MKPLLTPMPFKQHGILEIASLVPIKRHSAGFFDLKIKKSLKKSEIVARFVIFRISVNT